MSVKVANEIRPAEMPLYCSACGCQNPELPHVDFDAACDRGYGEGTKIAMEDLVLCETCLQAGARLVGMAPAGELEDRVAILERRLEEEQKRADQAANYASRMEEALGNRPTPVRVSRPRGRPRKHEQEVGV